MIRLVPLFSTTIEHDYEMADAAPTPRSQSRKSSNYQQEKGSLEIGTIFLARCT
jgi:hypothetical protein